jgi:chemotaxis protein CheZ
MVVAEDTAVVVALRAAVRAEVGGMISDQHRFVDRRIAELSAEVHGVSRLMDDSEANVTAQLARVHAQIEWRRCSAG